MCIHRILIATLLTAFLVTPSLAKTITTGQLVREMIDLRRLADFPEPAYKTVQFSSYDRRSNLPGGPDWFANSDGFGREPIPNFEAVLKPADDDNPGQYLICDVQGPGAIVRVWTARIEGTIHVYLDGSDKPVYEGAAQEFFQQTWYPWAKEAGLDPTILDRTFRQREAGYYPMPFAKGCRIVWVGYPNRVHFYQIQIRQYAPGTEVRTFKPADLKTYRNDIESVAKVLADPDHAWPYRSTENPVTFDAAVEPGGKADLFKREGTGALERLTLKVQADDLDAALRQTVLHVLCDDYPWGQVQCPIGDFFGAAPGINPYTSVPFSVAPDGTMTCRFFMPYKTSIRIVAENRGSQKVQVSGSALPTDYTWNDATSMHFRARWRADHNLTASPDAVQDIPYLVAQGKGVFLGVAVFVLNPDPIPTCGGNWWGEGDEKIFIDDDVRPSTFGTGSEDYFNYAWSSPDIFLFPYCGQPRNDGPANRGFVTNFRYQILDAMPFAERFAFYMELFSHEDVPGMSYSRIAYHYAKPGLMDDHLPIAADDLRKLELPANWQPAARGQARNSVFYPAEQLAEPDPKITFLENNVYAGGRLFVWQPSKSGEEITLTIPIAEAGKYRIRFVGGLNPSSGTLSGRLDDQPLTWNGQSTVNLYVPYRYLLRDHGSQPLELAKGPHKLVLKSEGPAQGQKGLDVGIDFVWVQPTK